MYPHTPKPPFAFLMLEALSPLSYVRCAFARPWLDSLPGGDGHAVIVVPGMMADDRLTAPLRHFLARKGYAVQGWHQGVNRGARPGVIEALVEQVRQAYRQGGDRKISLVGWSLGGLLVRAVANRFPEMIRIVVTLGAPFTGNPHATHLTWLYEAVTGSSVDIDDDFHHGYRPTPAVPYTSVFSRFDGVIPWPCSIELETDQVENVQVFCSHGSMVSDPTALAVVADRLAQPQGQWRKFELVNGRRFLYGNARRSAHEAHTRWLPPG